MKKLLGMVALVTLITAETFSFAAKACTYAGYPCSQWEQMRDRW